MVEWYCDHPQSHWTGSLRGRKPSQPAISGRRPCFRHQCLHILTQTEGNGHLAPEPCKNSSVYLCAFDSDKLCIRLASSVAVVI